MRIYGIDFTSAPCARKPVTVAMCRLEGETLFMHALCALESLDCFSNLLNCEGPWMAGVDFPFGLPRDFLEPLDWEPDWEGYVGAAGAMARAEFRDLARSVAAQRTPGQRYALRAVDRLAHAQSPMNVTRPPVGLMFHAGAPPLLASGVTVVPLRAGDPERTVVEAYPKLVAEALIGRRPYKDEGACAAGEPRTNARADLVDALGTDVVGKHYGVAIRRLDDFADELLADTKGDAVDALMCAVQAAWAWNLRDEGFGVPGDADSAEGWIADPVTAAAH